jgi:crotonobetainyl-CoA:carnitine CoA-transferase CaiB-like acyl-CoA transferase
MKLYAQGPLVGVQVLEVCEGQAGPYCGAILSDLGAGVIKVEDREGDYTRKLGPFTNGESAYFISYNRGKRGIALDLGEKKAREIVKELAAKCDIFIENLEPGEIESLGLDYETLKAVNPAIVYGSVSCYGRTGPLSKYPGNDIVAEAMGGHTSANGLPDGPPQPLGIALSEHCSGAELAWGLLCAYLHRLLKGLGQYVDVSVSDKNISVTENVLAFATMANFTRQRTGGHHTVVGPYGVFQAGDGAYAMGCGTNEMWGRVARAIGKPDLQEAEGWATNLDRGKNRLTHMIPLLNEWGKDKKRDDIVRLISDEAFVPCGPSVTHKEVRNNVHYRLRETVVDIEQPRAGKVSVASAFAGKMTDPRPAVQGPAPLLGEHNEEILTAIIGLTGEEIAGLYKKRILVQDLELGQPI